MIIKTNEKTVNEILVEYKQGKLTDPEMGMTNDQFIQLCNEEGVQLSYTAQQWAKEKLINILPGSCTRQGVINNKEVLEVLEAIFIARHYPEDIEDELEYGNSSKTVKEYLKIKLKYSK
jgi:hypothetical protein